MRTTLPLMRLQWKNYTREDVLTQREIQVTTFNSLKGEYHYRLSTSAIYSRLFLFSFHLLLLPPPIDLYDSYTLLFKAAIYP